MNAPGPAKEKFSFPGDRRIKKRKHFLQIQNGGKRIRVQNFLLLYRPFSESIRKTSQIGITITVKVHKRAVQRNKLRRRVREIFRLNLPQFARHAEMVVIALQGATELEYSEVKSQLFHLWKKAGLLPGPKYQSH